MRKLCTYIFLFTSLSFSCEGPLYHEVNSVQIKNSLDDPKLNVKMENDSFGRGALLLTRFNSFEEFKKIVTIEYFKGFSSPRRVFYTRPMVRVSHFSHGHRVTSILKTGVDEVDFMDVLHGGFLDKIWLVFNSPYAVFKRKDLRRVYALSRRREGIFGEGDVAFYDLAESMMKNISNYPKIYSSKDFTEKGFINTFNHITPQAFMTTLFSEKLADFVADTHERRNMPTLITGKFSQLQISDMENGPVDNYLDMINNEWGQELGIFLKEKYNITRKTNWTPELLSNYLNDIQSYCSWALKIAFTPFSSSDELVVRFSSKINNLMAFAPLEL